MSSELLNIINKTEDTDLLNSKNVNPLEEKSDEIKFTVDKMGLNTPASVVPTDVDYFIRKQQGKLESKYTFKEALGKAFDIDNFFVSGINKFMQDDGPAIDFDFVPTKEMFESVDKYPSYMRGAFYEARSKEHFYSIEKKFRKE